MIHLILDTDIGPDCDDAGALALLNCLADRGEAELLAVGNCRFYSEGSGCIDAICRYYGRKDIPVGETQREVFGERPEWEKYNKYIAAHFDNAYREEQAQDVVALYRRTLAAQPDHSVVFVAIGPLTNLGDLLCSRPDGISALDGAALVEKKVSALFAMAGRFGAQAAEAEWNVTEDIAAARAVIESWPTPVTLCPYELGLPVTTGARLVQHGLAENPVRKAYERYCGEGGRSSWDPATVYAAVRGCGALFGLSEAGVITVDAAGVTSFQAKPGGSRRYLKAAAPAEEIAAALDGLICAAPAALKR